MQTALKAAAPPVQTKVGAEAQVKQGKKRKITILNHIYMDVKLPEV